AGNYGRAVQLLNKHQPEAGEPDLRGFEWRYLWQVSRGDEHVALPDQDGAVHSLAISPSGELLVVGLRDKFNVWNLRSKTRVASVPRGVTAMAFFPDGGHLATFHQIHVRIWNTKDWVEEKSLPDALGSPFPSLGGDALPSVLIRTNA